MLRVGQRLSAENQKQPECPSGDKQTVVHAWKGKLLSNKNRRRYPVHAKVRGDLRGSALGEGSRYKAEFCLSC